MAVTDFLRYFTGRAIALRPKRRDLEADRPRRIPCELVGTEKEGVYFFARRGQKDPLPEEFSGWVAASPHDGVAHATTAHRTFHRMKRTEEGGVHFPSALLQTGGRCSVYAVDQAGIMRVAEVRLPVPAPPPQPEALQSTEQADT